VLHVTRPLWKKRFFTSFEVNRTSCGDKTNFNLPK
jgi:hypothetical protein